MLPWPSQTGKNANPNPIRPWNRGSRSDKPTQFARPRAGTGVSTMTYAFSPCRARALWRLMKSGQKRVLCSPSSSSRSEEHTSELQSLMRISYAVFCLKKKNTPNVNHVPANLTLQLALQQLREIVLYAEQTLT